MDIIGERDVEKREKIERREGESMREKARFRG